MVIINRPKYHNSDGHSISKGGKYFFLRQQSIYTLIFLSSGSIRYLALGRRLE
jgi:hypothetical protein